MKKTNEQGRSMIEMLGVLAIIGVLSVGGIAGFSKAMERYRVNKTMWQITYISNNIRTLFGSQKDYKDLGDMGRGTSAINLLKKAKVIPEDMYEGDNVKNMFGGRICNLYYREADPHMFVISYDRIPQEACIELMTTDWSQEGLVGINISDGIHAVNVYKGCPGTDRLACVGGSVTPVPMPVEKAVNACNSGNNNIIDWTFY